MPSYRLCSPFNNLCFSARMSHDSGLIFLDPTPYRLLNALTVVYCSVVFWPDPDQARRGLVAVPWPGSLRQGAKRSTAKKPKNVVKLLHIFSFHKKEEKKARARAMSHRLPAHPLSGGSKRSCSVLITEPQWYDKLQHFASYTRRICSLVSVYIHSRSAGAKQQHIDVRLLVPMARDLDRNPVSIDGISVVSH